MAEVDKYGEEGLEIPGDASLVSAPIAHNGHLKIVAFPHNKVWGIS